MIYVYLSDYVISNFLVVFRYIYGGTLRGHYRKEDVKVITKKKS
jgi:hypothetical protein